MTEIKKRALRVPQWGYTLSLGIIIGYAVGYFMAENRLYHDCRVAGATRLGSAAFKCEQYSRVVLLTPDEQAAKGKK